MNIEMSLIQFAISQNDLEISLTPVGISEISNRFRDILD